MRRFSTFVLGMVTGGLLLYGALNYHLIHAKDGLHVVPKVQAKLAGTYVDVRQFTPADWARQADLSLALFQADRADLMHVAAADAIWNGAEKVLAPPPSP